MSLAWGGNGATEQGTRNKLFADHVATEHACIEQAKQELGYTLDSGWEYLRTVLVRAQEIKEERKGSK